MSKILKGWNKLNKGAVITTGIVGGALSWIFAYDKAKDMKRKNMIVSKKALEIAIKVKEEIGDDFVDVHELSKDVQNNIEKAKQVRKSVENLQNNIKNEE